ncbi:hypothetical protein [Sporomusa aerivorans]|uniref:hypothetical protein n=1 Tax=Sporomusa aerivorans TaxID=204936 RepID=UPI003529DE66
MAISLRHSGLDKLFAGEQLRGMVMLKLVKPSAEYTKQIAEYREEFSVERERVTYDPSRIPGTDYLENYDNVLDWLAFCESMADKLTWYMTIRESDSRLVGFVVFRHKLEYDGGIICNSRKADNEYALLEAFAQELGHNKTG